jgi:dynein heavy chain
MFGTLMQLQPRSSSGGGITREEVIGEQAANIQNRLPDDFDIEAVSMAYPTRYEESMNTVVVKECIRYQALLSVVRATLPQLRKALKGLVVLSAELEEMGDRMFAQLVPTQWEAKAYPSLKPLDSWVTEFLQRLGFIQSWIDNGTPKCYWVSGFYFPQAFFTGQLQNYARALQIPIDTISFEQEYPDIEPSEITEKPAEGGCYVYGLFVEGARWDKQAKKLALPQPKVLYEEMPVIYFKPIQNRVELTQGVYRMPLYKILSRAGTLSTTGHSTNFVLFFNVPAEGTEVMSVKGKSDITEWIEAGTACFCSLKF